MLGLLTFVGVAVLCAPVVTKAAVVAYNFVKSHLGL
jgi:hypothetical protein